MFQGYRTGSESVSRLVQYSGMACGETKSIWALLLAVEYCFVTYGTGQVEGNRDYETDDEQWADSQRDARTCCETDNVRPSSAKRNYQGLPNWLK